MGRHSLKRSGSAGATVSSPVKLLEVDEYLKVVCLLLFSIGSSRPFRLTQSLMGTGIIASLGLIQTLTLTPFMISCTILLTQAIFHFKTTDME